MVFESFEDAATYLPNFVDAVFGRSHSASRSRTARSESCDRRAICCTRLQPLPARVQPRLRFAVLFRNGMPDAMKLGTGKLFWSDEHEVLIDIRASDVIHHDVCEPP